MDPQAQIQMQMQYQMQSTLSFSFCQSIVLLSHLSLSVMMMQGYQPMMQTPQGIMMQNQMGQVVLLPYPSTLLLFPCLPLCPHCLF